MKKRPKIKITYTYVPDKVALDKSAELLADIIFEREIKKEKNDEAGNTQNSI